MNRQAVQSSNLASVGYEPSAYTMEIEFKDGRVYQYFDVPQNVYQDLIGAPSPGQYFHQYVRGTYAFART